ncbi:GTP pyrophosphokinase family protein [Neorhizobium sp. T6_25]|uniref:GTP pyrophosphokinase n=1 Tax=Neorhizobium sp. T6_25 TaxID=2093833 RepID=UPI000CF92F5C|nr:RelA/SpoT family protein [Neorhizobium sp. T6_25]
MSKEEQLLDRWYAEKTAYLAWGKLISEQVQMRLAPLIAPQIPQHFLRTLVAPRLKDDQKLIEKAFFRNKAYTNPYDDITDKVGTRFVVLLGSDIRQVETALTSIEGWTFSKDRDYEEEQKKNPSVFDYSAVHFVVKPDTEAEFEGVQIPAGTPCEVQIKTLLQHAYSELTHDTIYKPQIQATPVMQRNAAKAMALLEATNDYFEKVADDVSSALSSVRKMTADLANIYREAVGIDPKPTVLEGMLLEAYDELAARDGVDQVRLLMAENKYIAERIRDHVVQRNPIFSQPSVLLVYLAVRKSVRGAVGKWPLTPSEMEPLLNDLGESNN